MGRKEARFRIENSVKSNALAMNKLGGACTHQDSRSTQDGEEKATISKCPLLMTDPAVCFFPTFLTASESHKKLIVSAE